jgi:60S ribosome subunit biogenesis protein NIP7
MRPLTEKEAKAMFEKLFKFVGSDVETFLRKKDKESYCFRLHKNKIYYIRESVMRKSTNISRDKLVSLGTQIGKFTHSGKFRLTITSLDLIAEFAKNKVWLKSSAEMSYLYGNNVLKSSMARITEGTPVNAGVVVYSMSDVPLGFGVSARATEDCRKLDPHSILVLHQADIGEYLRNENEIG